MLNWNYSKKKQGITGPMQAISCRHQWVNDISCGDQVEMIYDKFRFTYNVVQHFNASKVTGYNYVTEI